MQADTQTALLETQVPIDDQDAHVRTPRGIVARRGQGTFRRQLLLAYYPVPGHQPKRALASQPKPWVHQGDDAVHPNSYLASGFHECFACELLGRSG